jgi:hypothetical protein
MGAVLGTLIGVALQGIAGITRAAIVSSLRDVADRVERGELVSDDAIDALKEETDRIRDLIEDSG